MIRFININTFINSLMLYELKEFIHVYIYIMDAIISISLAKAAVAFFISLSV